MDRRLLVGEPFFLTKNVYAGVPLYGRKKGDGEWGGQKSDQVAHLKSEATHLKSESKKEKCNGDIFLPLPKSEATHAVLPPYRKNTFDCFLLNFSVASQ